MTNSKSGWLHFLSSPCRPSPWKATPTGQSTRPSTAYRDKFSGKYDYRLITGGVGHNLPQEAPQEFAKAVIDVDAF